MATVVMDQEKTNEQWRRRIKAHKKEITSYLNPSELMHYFICHKLLSSGEKEFLSNELITRESKAEFILEILETSDVRNAYTIFFNCLYEYEQEGGEHLGHEFLLALLRGEEYATEDECRVSLKCAQCISEHRKDLYDIDLFSLIPVMLAHCLITTNEGDMLERSSRTQIEKIEQLLCIIETKGPLAHKIFSQCLREETSHPTHNELHRKITSVSHCADGIESDSPRVMRKRKRDNYSAECSIPKRNPILYRMEKPLCGKVYKIFLTNVRECYQTSSWKELERIASKFIQNNSDPQLVALATIEIGYSMSCRKEMRQKAQQFLGKALIMASRINGSNRKFLMARCTHILGTIQRYLGDEQASLEENKKAFKMLGNCEQADDASRITYGMACAELERLGKNPTSLQEVKNMFERAIEYGRNGTPGMCASEERCLIRLAQLSLGTTTNGVCVLEVNEENVEKAEDYLKQVKVDSVSLRCQALYYVIQSDLYKRKGDLEGAVASSKKALKIAEDSNLGAELQFAESRLKSLRIQD